jgi:hypothetical protein
VKGSWANVTLSRTHLSTVSIAHHGNLLSAVLALLSHPAPDRPVFPAVEMWEEDEDNNPYASPGAAGTPPELLPRPSGARRPSPNGVCRGSRWTRPWHIVEELMLIAACARS